MLATTLVYKLYNALSTNNYLTTILVYMDLIGNLFKLLGTILVYVAFSANYLKIMRTKQNKMILHLIIK